MHYRVRTVLNSNNYYRRHCLNSAVYDDNFNVTEGKEHKLTTELLRQQQNFDRIHHKSLLIDSEPIKP